MLVKSLVDWIACRLQVIEELLSPGAIVLAVRRSVQLDRYSCGAQSAFMILRYFGKARSIEAVTKALGTTEDGTGTMTIVRLFRHRGLKPRIKARADVHDLATAVDLGAPSLVSMDDGEHWAVVYGYARGAVFLADPSIKRSLRVRVPTTAFCARWDRWAMVVRHA